MKTFRLSQFSALLFCALFLFFQSCRPPVPGSWKNDKIEQGKRDDFHKLNAEALKCLKANNAYGLKMVFSKEMNDDNNQRQVDLISNRLNDNDYQLMDEFYVVHKYKDTDTVAFKGGSINRYALICPYEAQEMYMAFFVPKKSDNKYMISLIYGKFNYGWKIVKMNLAPYTINRKTGAELYALAREQYDKKHMQAALDNLILAVASMKPCDYWQYPDETDAEKLYTTVHDEINAAYRYPLVLKQIATGPMILRVYNKNTDDGYSCPVVYYMTHFPISDTTEIKKENQQIRQVVNKIMPGLGENDKYILYSAFNKVPDGYNSVDHFDMAEKVQ